MRHGLSKEDPHFMIAVFLKGAPQRAFKDRTLVIYSLYNINKEKCSDTRMIIFCGKHCVLWSLCWSDVHACAWCTWWLTLAHLHGNASHKCLDKTVLLFSKNLTASKWKNLLFSFSWKKQTWEKCGGNFWWRCSQTERGKLGAYFIQLWMTSYHLCSSG